MWYNLYIMKIRKSTENDLNQMMDIKSGKSYVCVNDNDEVIGAFCINWAYEQCKHLRIDTHEDNVVMQNLVKKLGFKYCGIIHIKEDNDPRLAYEKI